MPPTEKVPLVELEVTFETVGTRVSYVIVVVELAVLLFPAASVNLSAATETEPEVLCVSAVGSNPTVYEVLETAVNENSVPPITVISPGVKPVGASKNVNVNVDFSPDFSVVALAAIETVGA